MFIAWTTVATQGEADRLANAALAPGLGLAVCVQIEGPVTSHFRWAGKLERAEEFRLTFKCLPERLAALEAVILAAHPYAVPEWIVVRAAHVSEKYLSWARGDVHSPTL